MANPAVDLYTTYHFVKRLVTPFNKWDAYKLGIIDENGQQLKHRADLKTDKEKAAYGFSDLLAANLKRLLAKVPGGDKTISTYAAALLLLKEYPKVQKEDMSLIDELPELLEKYMAEEAPTNSTGPAVAGTIGEPIVRPKNKYKKNNEKDARAIEANVSSILRRKSNDQV